MKHAVIFPMISAAAAAQELNAVRDDLALKKMALEGVRPELSGTPLDTGPGPLCVEVYSTLHDGREMVILIARRSPRDRPEVPRVTGKSSLHSSQRRMRKSIYGV